VVPAKRRWRVPGEKAVQIVDDGFVLCAIEVIWELMSFTRCWT